MKEKASFQATDRKNISVAPAVSYKKTFIVIPGFNEQKHIGNVVSRVKKCGFDNVIFVDDGSKDRSGAVAKKAGAVLLSHIVNMGKGAAAKTGCDYALKSGAETIVIMDADGQHKPEDIQRFIKKLKGKDIVFGYRERNKNMPAVMKLGNWYLNLASKLINGIELQDTQSGFRCFTAEAYKKIRWSANDYSMESEMIANAAKKKLKFAEIPIATIYLDDFKGTTIFHGIKIFINMLKFRLLGGKL